MHSVLKVVISSIAGLALAVAYHWLTSRPKPSAAVTAAISSAEVWLDVLDGEGYQLACSAQYVGDNWTTEECMTALEPYYGDGEVRARDRESWIHLSGFAPELTSGERVLVVYGSRFEAGEVEENLVMADQSGWKVDGYFVHPEE